MGPLLIALLAFLGSSAAAAWITNTWQRRKYQAETLHDGFKRIVEARAEFTRAVSACASLLRIAHSLGKIWNYQRVKFQENLENAGSHAVTLDAAQTLNAVAHPWSAVSGRQVAQTAQAALNDLGLVTFIPIAGDAERNGVTVQLTGGNPNDVADRLIAHLNQLAQQTGELTAQTADRHEDLVGGGRQRLRPVWALFAVVVLLATVAVYFWSVGAWVLDLRDDRAVWVHSLTGEVRVVSIPKPSVTSTTGSKAGDAGASSSEALQPDSRRVP